MYNPLKYSCLENLHGQRRLAVYSPRGRKSWTPLSGLTTTTTVYNPAWLSYLKITEPRVTLGSSCIDLVPGPSFISYVRSWASESIFLSLCFHICKTWKIVYLLTSLLWGFSKESCLTWNKHSVNVQCVSSLVWRPSKAPAATAAAKSRQSCPTLCDPIDGSPPGSSIPGILQARTLEWLAISFSNAWKWKVKGKLLSRVQLLVTPWTAAYQAPLSMGFSRQEYWSGVPLLSPSKAPLPLKYSLTPLSEAFKTLALVSVLLTSMLQPHWTSYHTLNLFSCLIPSPLSPASKCLEQCRNSVCVTLEEEEGGVGSWSICCDYSYFIEEWTEAKWPLS